MTRYLVALCAALALTLASATASFAHKVNIFAYVDGDTVVTESGYNRSERVHQGKVTVSDAASGAVLLTGVTNDKGDFSFKIPEKARTGKMDLQLLLDAGVGHQAHWTIKYAEYAAEAPASAPAAAPAPTAASPEAAPAAVAQAPAPVDTAAIEAVVRREVAPIKQMLLEMHESGPSLVEIFGGIGWIFGLFGVAAYMKSRRS